MTHFQRGNTYKLVVMLLCVCGRGKGLWEESGCQKTTWIILIFIFRKKDWILFLKDLNVLF